MLLIVFISQINFSLHVIWVQKTPGLIASVATVKPRAVKDKAGRLLVKESSVLSFLNISYGNKTVDEN